MQHRFRSLTLLAGVASLLLVGCQPEVERDDLGELMYKIPKIPGSDKKIVVKPYRPKTAKNRGGGSSKPAKGNSPKPVNVDKGQDAVNEKPARAAPAQEATPAAETAEESPSEGTSR